MLARELLTMLSRLPHDAIVLVDDGEQLQEIKNIIIEMSPDLYEQRDHVIIKLEK